MPPPMPNPSKRMTAQPLKPVARYRPGKAVQEDESSDEDESEEETQQAPPPRKAPTTRPQAQKPLPKGQEQEDSDEEGFVTDEDDDDGGVHIPAVEPTDSTKPVATLQRPAAPVGPSEPSEEESEDESDSGSDDSAASSSSESDVPTRKFQRPTFIKKTDRTNGATTNTTSTSQPPASAALLTPTPALTATSITPAPEDLKARRLAETDFLISEKINRDNLARAAGRRAWDDDDNLEPSSVIDDTDDLDPPAEHAAWRLRELTRLKRDREALIAREREIEETERRRNLTAAEREAEDREFLDKQKEEKEGKGQAGFLARYHHKGAFFQGEEVAEQLKGRDVMGARFEDEVDRSVLPSYMQIRDLNKLGRKGRTRYRDLRAEDTGGFAEGVKRWKGAMGAGNRGGGEGGGFGAGGDMRGVDERFFPDDDRRGGGGPMSSGANNAPLGPRRSDNRARERDRDRQDVRRDDRDSYRPAQRRRSRSPSRSRSRSRSRSPPRRKRSRSRERYRDSDDKCRRVESSEAALKYV